ncbi:MAG: hypothetical protein Q9191_001740 [Dirinaria sp. TL-2023a]
MARTRMDLRTLGYVFVSVITVLLNHEEDWGYGQWIRVQEAGLVAEEAPPLLDIYIVPRIDLKGPISNFVDHNDTNMTLPGNKFTANPANAIDVAVEYTGTPLTRTNIFQLITLAVDGFISSVSVAPYAEGLSEISTSDGKARMLVDVVGEHLVTFFAQGILDLLYHYTREKRWETSTATFKYGEALFATITIEDVPVELDGPSNGDNDFNNETATS